MNKDRYWDKRLWRWVRIHLPSTEFKPENTDWKNLPNSVKFNIASNIMEKKNRFDNYCILHTLCGIFLLGMIIALALKYFKRL